MPSLSDEVVISVHDSIPVTPSNISVAYDSVTMTTLLCCNNEAYFIDGRYQRVSKFDPNFDVFAPDWISDVETPGELTVCGAGEGLAIVRDGPTAWIIDIPSQTSHERGILLPVEEFSSAGELAVTVVDRQTVTFTCSSWKTIARYQKNGHFWSDERCNLSHDIVSCMSPDCSHYNANRSKIPVDDSFTFGCPVYPLQHRCLYSSDGKQLVLSGDNTLSYQRLGLNKTLMLGKFQTVASATLETDDSVLLLCLSQSAMEVVRWTPSTQHVGPISHWDGEFGHSDVYSILSSCKGYLIVQSM